KRHLRNGTPSCLLNFRAFYAPVCERCDLGFQVVAHEIELVGPLLGGVECGFRRGQGEDEPAMTRIHRFEPEYVAEKGAIRHGVFSVDNYVCAGNHFALLRNAQTPSRISYFPWNLKTRTRSNEDTSRFC